MKFKVKMKHAVIAAANVLAITGAIILTAVGGSMARSQSYNYAADSWGNGGELGYSQISCFLSEDSGFTVDSVLSVRSQVLSSLKTASVTPEEGKKLCPDAYSVSVGTASVRGDAYGRAEAEITAVGGDFFMFRSFTLLDGAYFTESDIMQDGAVIDKSLAWSLYGSERVSGMNIYINDVKYYIAGVIDTPSTKPEQDCAGDSPRAYISLEAADSFGSTNVEENTSRSITCYECIVPDPVENFAINSIKNFFSSAYNGKANVVCNTGRFDSSKRVKALKKLTGYAVRKDSISYPYWENASRIVEMKLTFIYAGRRLLLAVPVITVIWLIILAIKFYNRHKAGFKHKTVLTADRLWHKLKRKMPWVKNKKDTADV